QMAHAGADLYDDAGRLMTEDGGERERDAAVQHVQIGVADAAVRDPHLHLARPRPFDVQVVDDEEILAGGFHEGGSHGGSLAKMDAVDPADTLDVADVDPNPLDQFERWFGDEVAARVPEPNAMAVSTVGADGAPSTRFVLLKGVDERGFQFFTNYRSRKG